MKFEVVKMTPEAAADLLAASARVRQRHLTPSAVARYTRAIETGRWQATHQGIAITRAGEVYRRPAPADRDREGWDPAGHSDGNAMSAAARAMIGYDAVVGTTRTIQSATSSITAAELLEFVESERGQRLAGMLPYARRIAAAWGRPGWRTWLAASVTLLCESGWGDDVVLAFVSEVVDGVMLPPGSPVLALRRLAMNGLDRVPGGYRSTYGIAIVIKTFNDARLGRSRQSLSFRVGVEAMPAVIDVPGGGAR